MSSEKYASGFHIPELIEQAHRVAQAENEHTEQSESIPTYEYYDSPIEIDGTDYMAHIRVRNTQMGDKYYGHTISEVEDIKIEPSARTFDQGKPRTVQPVNAIDGSIGSIPQTTPAVKADTASAKCSGPMSRAELTDQILSRALPLPQGSGDGRMERVVREGVQKGLTKLARTSEGKLALFNLALWKGDGFGKAFDDAIVDWVVWNTPDNPTEGSDHLADALYTTLVDYFQNKLAGDGKAEAKQPKSPSKEDTLVLPDIQIGTSLGAKAKNYEIIDKQTGEVYHFLEGTHLQNVEVFAGSGVRTPLRLEVMEGLAQEFGGTPDIWQHVKGIGELTSDGEESRLAEVHWFQAEGVDKVKFILKRWLDE